MCDTPDRILDAALEEGRIAKEDRDTWRFALETAPEFAGQKLLEQSPSSRQATHNAFSEAGEREYAATAAATLAEGPHQPYRTGVESSARADAEAERRDMQDIEWAVRSALAFSPTRQREGVEMALAKVRDELQPRARRLYEAERAKTKFAADLDWLEGELLSIEGPEADAA